MLPFLTCMCCTWRNNWPYSSGLFCCRLSWHYAQVEYKWTKSHCACGVHQNTPKKYIWIHRPCCGKFHMGTVFFPYLFKDETLVLLTVWPVIKAAVLGEAGRWEKLAMKAFCQAAPGQLSDRKPTELSCSKRAFLQKVCQSSRQYSKWRWMTFPLTEGKGNQTSRECHLEPEYVQIRLASSASVSSPWAPSRVWLSIQ